MERLKNKSLKQAFFTITALYLTIGLLLAALSFFACLKIRSHFESQQQIQISLSESGRILSNSSEIKAQADTKKTSHKNSSFSAQTALSVLQMILPVFFVMLSLILADITFYRWKLKKPLEILKQSAARFQKQDLDFTVETCGNDELGQLCSAFETMRAGLLESNRALWHQVEERRRLNAAFAHDLRNPVTVLKGSAKLLEQRLDRENLTPENAGDSVTLISQYAARIETYVAAMTSAQKLEELECRPTVISWPELKTSLKNSLELLAAPAPAVLYFQGAETTQKIKADQNLLFNVAENLVYNALRYAKTTVTVTLTLQNSETMLTVSDDGPGFSQAILKKGAAPFLRDTASPDPQHFGMGLYISRLLCQKHGGTLTLANTPSGASVTAKFHTPNP